MKKNVSMWLLFSMMVGSFDVTASEERKITAAMAAAAASGGGGGGGGSFSPQDEDNSSQPEESEESTQFQDNLEKYYKDNGKWWASARAKHYMELLNKKLPKSKYPKLRELLQEFSTTGFDINKINNSTQYQSASGVNTKVTQPELVSELNSAIEKIKDADSPWFGSGKELLLEHLAKLQHSVAKIADSSAKKMDVKTSFGDSVKRKFNEWGTHIKNFFNRGRNDDLTQQQKAVKDDSQEQQYRSVFLPRGFIFNPLNEQQQEQQPQQQQQQKQWTHHPQENIQTYQQQDWDQKKSQEQAVVEHEHEAHALRGFQPEVDRSDEI